MDPLTWVLVEVLCDAVPHQVFDPPGLRVGFFVFDYFDVIEDQFNENADFFVCKIRGSSSFRAGWLVRIGFAVAPDRGGNCAGCLHLGLKSPTHMFCD